MNADKPMERKTNALEELAETMNTPVELPPVGAKGLIVLNKIQFEAYKKSQRIVAELAKVKFWELMDGTIMASFSESGHALEKCRAIAEEGAGDGK